MRIYHWAAEHGWKPAEARLTQMKERCRKEAIEAGVALVPINRLYHRLEYQWKYNTPPSKKESVGRDLMKFVEDTYKPAWKEFGDALYHAQSLGVTGEEAYEDAFTYGYRELMN